MDGLNTTYQWVILILLILILILGTGPFWRR
jgi:hypothetical protein